MRKVAIFELLPSFYCLKILPSDNCWQLNDYRERPLNISGILQKIFFCRYRFFCRYMRYLIFVVLKYALIGAL